MQNVRKDQLKKCIFLTVDEFRQAVKEFFGEDTMVEIDLEGVITIETYEDPVYTEEVWTGLAKYFGVSEVTSVHTDCYEPMGVWIVYKEEADGNV